MTAEPEGSPLAAASFGCAALLAGPGSPPLERAFNPILLQDAPEARQSFGTANMLSIIPVERSLSMSLTTDGITEDQEPIIGRLTKHPSAPIAGRGTIRASDYNGRAVYIKRKPRSQPRPTEASRLADSSHLLDVPLHRLRLQLSLHSDQRTSSVSTPSLSTRQASGLSDSALWVDLYRPKKYIDLLGDERVHRETMAWVKEWDRCVFGKTHGRKRTRDYGDNASEPDQHHRPQDRILLLSGPPGLGKTTLAHVVANQAGYSVYEVNASDARTGSAVEERIQPLLETGFLLGNKKPVLLVVDEIDGSAGGENASGFVHKLLMLVSENRKKGRSKETHAKRPVLRPIICICNDLYAPSLAKLRQHARVIRCNRSAELHVVNRLREVCEDQELRADSTALTSLVRTCRSDLRACINALQFIKLNHIEVTESVVRDATKGVKENDTSFHDALVDLFVPLTKKRAKIAGVTVLDEHRYAGRLTRQIESSDAFDKIALGCFEHYIQLRQHEANLSRHEKAIEWLTTFDAYEQVIRSQSQYALWPYQAYFLVAFYPLFQQDGSPKPDRPKADWEHYMKTKTNSEISSSLGRCLQGACTRLAGSYRHLSSKDILQLELAPYLNRIINPPLHPINNQISRPEDKVSMTRLVEIMLALDLHFYQEKGEDGQLVYRLDPPIDIFVTYDGKRSVDIAPSRYAVRHAVATELERRAEIATKSNGRIQHLSKLGLGGTPSIGPGLSKGKIAEKVAVDFFGRPIAQSKTQQRLPDDNEPGQTTKPRLTYRYNEGNSAAVRRPARMQAFL